MFSKQTVFVVGAGASVEFGLPVGKTLATTIQGKMDIRFQFPDKPLGGGDFELFTQLTHRRRNEAQSFEQAALLIRNGIGLALSIDDFLDLHRANKYVNEYGKAAIVKSILEAEHASSLFFAGPAERDLFNPEKCKDTWIMKFFSMLSRGVPREERQNVFDHVSFITFNYDRCIEHFLENALQSLYAISNEEAVDLVKKLSIIHPYGKVEDVAFGTTRTDYAELAASIKTYTERVHVAEVIDKIHEEVLRAETITFLGFGYHDQNMSLIEPVNPIPIPKDIFGTAYGMSISDSNVTTNQILRWFDEGLTQEIPENADSDYKHGLSRSLRSLCKDTCRTVLRCRKMPRLRTHPGEILAEDYLKPLALSASALAQAIGVPPNRQRHHSPAAGTCPPTPPLFWQIF